MIKWQLLDFADFFNWMKLLHFFPVSAITVIFSATLYHFYSKKVVFYKKGVLKNFTKFLGTPVLWNNSERLNLYFLIFDANMKYLFWEYFRIWETQGTPLYFHYSHITPIYCNIWILLSSFITSKNTGPHLISWLDEDLEDW